MSEEIKFKGPEHLQALSFTQNLEKKHRGYIEEADTIPTVYMILIQQNNTILALLSNLYFKLTTLEKLIVEVPKSSQSIYQELVDITNNLKNISIDKTKPTKKIPKNYKILKYDKSEN